MRTYTLLHIHMMLIVEVAQVDYLDATLEI